MAAAMRAGASKAITEAMAGPFRLHASSREASFGSGGHASLFGVLGPCLSCDRSTCHGNEASRLRLVERAGGRHAPRMQVSVVVPIDRRSSTLSLAS